MRAKRARPTLSSKSVWPPTSARSCSTPHCLTDSNVLVTNARRLCNFTPFHRARWVSVSSLVASVRQTSADLVVQAKSGTGKTLVFVILAIGTVQCDNPRPQVIIVAPTREIAVQIHACLRAVGAVYMKQKKLSVMYGFVCDGIYHSMGQFTDRRRECVD
jgi:superfamily II DNA or RNA helicase